MVRLTVSVAALACAGPLALFAAAPENLRAGWSKMWLDEPLQSGRRFAPR
jgi:hypothetical protein